MSLNGKDGLGLQVRATPTAVTMPKRGDRSSSRGGSMASGSIVNVLLKEGKR